MPTRARLPRPARAARADAPADPFIARGKLSPPHCAFEPVLPRAAEVLLRSAVSAPLVLACAPAGYGKTLLLAHLHQLLRQRGQRCLWLTLDDRDTAIGSLAWLVAAALRQLPDDAAEPDAGPGSSLGMGTGTGTGTGMGAGAGAGEPLAEPAAEPERWLQQLAALPGRTVLFIDNLHCCTDPQLPALLERLVFGCGPRLRLVLSATHALPLDMTRARLELGAVELGPAQLALDAHAAAGLFERAGLPRPDADALGRILHRTEGWPAAVRLLQVLVAQSTEGLGEDTAADNRADATTASPPAPAALQRVLARFSGEDHDIAQVLTRRVLAGFEPRRVQFLTEIALVREFSAELAEAMTGQPQAGRWIDELLQRNVLVFPLDRSRHWLRLHTLLRQHLLAEGRRRLGREHRRALLERAAHWHAERGDDLAALEAALEAPAIALASRLLDRVARLVAGDQGRLAEYIHWVEQLVAAGAVLSLEAHAWYVWSLCFTLRDEQAHAALEALDHRLAESPPLPRERGGMRARLSLLRVVVGVYLDALDGVRAEADAWLAQPRPLDPLALATVATGAAIARLGLGERREARALMQQAAAAVERTDSAYGHAWVAAATACIELTEGEPLKAERLIAHTHPRVSTQLGPEALVLASLDFVHARALLDMGRLAAARDKALRGLQRARAHGVGETALHGLAACVGLWQGEAEGPFALPALQQVARRYPARVQQQLAIAQARRLLRLGRLDEARALADGLPELPGLAERGDRAERGPRSDRSDRPGPGATGTSLQAAATLLQLELLAAAGRGREVLARTEPLLKTLQALGLAREQLELQLLAAELQARADDLRAAQRSLTMAVLLAVRRRLLQPFHERLGLVGRVLGGTRLKDFGFTQPDELALLDDLRDACRAAGTWPAAEAAATGDARAGRPARPTPAARPPRDAAEPGAPASAPALAPPPGASASRSAVGPLTPRELQLLAQLGLGLDNQQLADRLGLSVATVKWHLLNLYAKLAVKNRAAALAKARTLDLLPR